MERKDLRTLSSRVLLVDMLRLANEHLSTSRYVDFSISRKRLTGLIPYPHNAFACLHQIVLYVVSRVIVSFLPRVTPVDVAKKGPNGTNRPIPPSPPLFAAFAALSWGAIMWLFRFREETLLPGIWSSMKYLYLDSEQWESLKTLLWHNK